MRGVQIRDMNESGHVLAVDLQHILDLFGERTIQSRWRASEVWATSPETGEAAVELERLADGQTFITGEHLSRIAHDLTQVIDGEFSAFERSSDSPWIIVRAVDSSFYEVFSTDPAVLGRVRESFQKVSDCDYMA
ncbi:MAG: hypothetical protein AMXMBFR7_02530 [Planctomycetota bacterium]